MQPEFGTFTSKGQLVIPARMRRKFGIRKGTRVAIVEEDHRIILQPVTEDFIESLWGSLKGGPSLSDLLKKERRREFEIEERKIKEFRARRQRPGRRF
jgi:AbrB family looped-hinge helix DNA binding protein